MKYLAFLLLFLGAIFVYGSQKIIKIKAIKNIFNTNNEEELLLKSNVFKLIGFAIALIGAIIIFTI